MDDHTPIAPPSRYRRPLLAFILALPLLLALAGAWVGQERLATELDLRARLLEGVLRQATAAATPDAWRRWLSGEGRVVSLDRPLLPRRGWLLHTHTFTDPQGRAHRIHLAAPLDLAIGTGLAGGGAGLALSLLIYLFALRLPAAEWRRLQTRIAALEADLTRVRKERDRLDMRTKTTSRAIHHLAFSDLLTDLPNRIRLSEDLEAYLLDSTLDPDRIAAVITFDLDNFKEINDTLGHARGDKVLRQLGARLKERIKHSDLLGRLGGDEFAVILFDLPSRNEAVEVANRLIEAIAEPFVVEGIQFELSASLGIAIYPEHGTQPQELFQRADTAMYQAKAAHSGLMVYDPATSAAQSERLTLKTELRRAIDEGQLQLYFQPKIDLARGHIVGVESLVRWIHPERGFIGPDVFVPLAERSNLIHPMTGLVFNIALHQCGRWLAEGLELGVAVNCSAHSLGDEHLPERIDALLYTWGVPSRLLTVEVTESAIMAQPEQALAVLTRLHELGVKISIDDYGTGYSSLSYIKSMPVSELKIDRAFVSDMLTDENDAVIVRATIDMAHDLGLEVTAEGIEDQATWDALVELGCDRAQGFFMGRPQTAADLARWLRESPFGLAGGHRASGAA